MGGQLYVGIRVKSGTVPVLQQGTEKHGELIPASLGLVVQSLDPRQRWPVCRYDPSDFGGAAGRCELSSPP